jgi:hypothetical protein
MRCFFMEQVLTYAKTLLPHYENDYKYSSHAVSNKCIIKHTWQDILPVIVMILKVGRLDVGTNCLSFFKENAYD